MVVPTAFLVNISIVLMKIYLESICLLLMQEDAKSIVA